MSSKRTAKWGRFRFRTILPAAACVATLSVASTSVEAVAQESPLTAIISEISRYEADINRINLEIGNLREAVNQALVDLHDAQSLAEQARRGADEARKRLDETQADVEHAQSDLDQISRSSYRSSGANGSPVHADADGRKDSLDRQTYLRKESEEKQRALKELQRARTEAANYESTLRQASRLADERATVAEEAETHARETLDETLTSLETQLAQRDAASVELEQAQTELVEQRPEAAAAIGIEPEAESAAQAEHDSSEPASAPQAPETESAPAIPSDSSASETPSADTAEPASSTEESEPSVEDEPTESSEVSEPTESVSANTAEEEALQEDPAEEEPGHASEPEVDEGAETAPETAAPEAPTAPTLDDFANPDTVQAALDAFAEAVGQTQADHTSFDNPYSDAANAADTADTGSSEGSEGIAAPSSSDSADAAVAATDEEEGTNVAGVLPEVSDAKNVTDELRGTETASDANRSQQIEAVIARAESQIGTPYVWGGGDANGATMGLDGQGYNGKAGYDCSGLVLYAYSGAGVSLPHYTGYQYQRGTQIPVDEAERGDLLFWGNGGSQHVAIYLGDGMMLEAPQTGMNVQKTAVRRNGLAPMAVRLI
ncbi:DIP1281 family NlpC/P60 protein [Corynebacterium urinipleomorphum]|uniref:DIP1281 family NlpC/P60 protein n=1 Tax=Corynebacterium urinipleomorphum TaxID=1852380 RepID=UPI0038B36A68